MITSALSFDAVLDLLADKIAARLQPAPASEHRLLTVKEAARRMDSSPSSIRHLIASGQIPPRVVRHFGRSIRLDQTEFDKWMSAQ
jgi:excisionase family DNA binding protein